MRGVMVTATNLIARLHEKITLSMWQACCSVYDSGESEG
jgi:hypothetical protein